ncbi:hypothetical protein AVEN_84762-1 [Araneus ventricosus]|uniref:Uncharacterized protein n=1 Tax=Araneus ventricosus TaxID=182803 RepID=A0A4Y2W7T9_ARAVE|nr:hypothetical protein AVEN_84762-1 [Araneus ventricosus]
MVRHRKWRVTMEFLSLAYNFPEKAGNGQFCERPRQRKCHSKVMKTLSKTETFIGIDCADVENGAQRMPRLRSPKRTRKTRTKGRLQRW